MKTRNFPRLSEWGTALLVGAALAFSYGFYEYGSKSTYVASLKIAGVKMDARKETLDGLIDEFKAKIVEYDNRLTGVLEREAVAREAKIGSDLPARSLPPSKWAPVVTCIDCKPPSRVDLGTWGAPAVLFNSKKACDDAGSATFSGASRKITFECKPVEQ